MTMKFLCGGLVFMTVALYVPPAVHGFGSGAPDKGCPGISPIHAGQSPQAGTPPYTITLSRSTYSAGDTVTVTLASPGESLVGGFMIQARRADPTLDTSTPIGEFTTIDTSTTKITCSQFGQNRGVTHTNGNQMKSSVQVTWTAPTPSAGHIIFYYAVAQSHGTFWAKQPSSVLEDPTAAPLPTVAPGATNPGVTTSGSTPSNAPVTQGSVIAPISAEGCGVTKGCYRDPDKCDPATTCEHIVTWTDAGGGYVNFELQAKSTLSSPWVAVGYGNNAGMRDASVTDCVYNQQTGIVAIEQSFNVKDVKSNEVLSDKSLGIDNFESSFADGKIRCRWRRQRDVGSSSSESSKVFPLTQGNTYHILLARGQSANGVKIPHTEHPAVSGEKVDLTQNAAIGGRGPVSPMIKAHACLMVLAWVMTASLGMFIARYYKPMWPDFQPCDLQLWFTIHRSLMISTACFTIAAFIIIFVHVMGYSSYTSLPSSAHPPLGIIITALVCINPLMALFRPGKDAATRPIFNWAHWGVGTCAHILSVPAILIGLKLSSANAPDWAFWVMVGAVCFHVLMELIMEVHEYFIKERGQKDNDIPMGQLGQKSHDDSSSSKPAGEGLKKFMIALYILGMVGCAVAIVVAIIMGAGNS